MIEHILYRDVELCSMVELNPNIRKSIFDFMYKIINMIHAERYDPRSVQLEALTPAGENNKICVMLKGAKYSTAPIIEPVITPDHANYKFASFIGSLYKAVVGTNGSIEGFINACPDLATFTYIIANRIYEYRYKWRRQDFKRAMTWDVFDHWMTNDLFINGFIP